MRNWQVDYRASHSTTGQSHRAPHGQRWRCRAGFVHDACRGYRCSYSLLQPSPSPWSSFRDVGRMIEFRASSVAAVRTSAVHLSAGRRRESSLNRPIANFPMHSTSFNQFHPRPHMLVPRCSDPWVTVVGARLRSRLSSPTVIQRPACVTPVCETATSSGRSRRWPGTLLHRRIAETAAMTTRPADDPSCRRHLP